MLETLYRPDQCMGAIGAFWREASINMSDYGVDWPNPTVWKFPELCTRCPGGVYLVWVHNGLCEERGQDDIPRHGGSRSAQSSSTSRDHNVSMANLLKMLAWGNKLEDDVVVLTWMLFWRGAFETTRSGCG